VFIYVGEAAHDLPEEGPLSHYHPELPEPERRHSIAEINRELDLPFVCLFDRDTQAEEAYTAFPERLVIVDSEGRVAYDAGAGVPSSWDFNAVKEQLQQTIETDSELSNLQHPKGVQLGPD
jgi:hypothetical protein